MKKTTFLKTMLLLCALVAGSNVWATDVTFTFNTDAGLSELGISKPSTGEGTNLDTDPYTLNGVSIVSISATNGTKTRVWNSSGTLDLRIYNGGTFTFTAPANITKIVLSGSTVNGFSTEVGTYSKGTWTGDAASVTLTATGTEKINTITVTYTAAAVEIPILSPGAGTVEKGTLVTMSTSTGGASIYYTTDGSTPSSSSLLYSGAITINSAQTIKAIAIKGGDESVVATAVYTIKKVNTPTFSVAEGEVLEGTTVELETTTEGATIHYTTDGTDPTASSPTYSSAITIDADMTIKAIATKANWDDSEVASAGYSVVALVRGLSIDFETNKVSTYSDWDFYNIVAATSTITAHGGTYYGSTDGKSTASVTTKAKIAHPGTFTCYISKESNNTTTSNWKIQTSSDGSDWTDVATKSATEMSKGVWQIFSADLSAYSDVYVRLYYGSNTAKRAVDDIVLTENAVITLADACTDGSKYYGTYSNSKAFVVPADLTVSEINVAGGVLALTDYAEGDIVPANTGVLVASTTAGDHTVTLTAGGTSVLGSDNMLKPSGDAGIDGASMAAAAPSCKYYRLTMHGGTKIGFWWGAAEGAAFDIAANKAYLAVPTAGARAEGLWISETSSIHNAQCTMRNEAGTVYNLNGQRVDNAQLKKGVFIQNGKKIIMR